MLTLGLHSLGHDTGVCLWDDGELVFTMETERLTRVRYETRVDAALKAVRAHPSFDLNRIGRIASKQSLSQKHSGGSKPGSGRASFDF